MISSFGGLCCPFELRAITPNAMKELNSSFERRLDSLCTNLLNTRPREIPAFAGMTNEVGRTRKRGGFQKTEDPHPVFSREGWNGWVMQVALTWVRIAAPPPGPRRDKLASPA